MATQIYSNSKKLDYSANSSSGYQYTFTLKITRDTQNVSGNYTPTTAVCSLTSPKSRWDTNASYGQLSVILYWIKADGTYGSKTVTGDKINQSAYDTTYSVSVSQDVPHLNDGTSKIYAVGKWYSSASNSYRPKSTSLTSDVISLPTIPRASDITATSGYIGETITIYIDRKSDVFTEELNWSCKNLSGVINNPDNLKQIPFTIPTSIYSLIPDDKSVDITITAITYNGSIKVGEKNATLTARVDENKNKPTISSVKIEETNTKVSDLTDKLVLNASKPKITINADAKNGATIKSIVTTNEDGQNYTGSPVIFDAIGKAKFTIVVTDSRELPPATEVIDKTTDAIPYIQPNIKTIEVERESPISGKIVLNIQGSLYSGKIGTTQNELTIHYRYKENSTNATWSDPIVIPKDVIEINPTNNTYEIKNYNLGEITYYNKQYTFEIYYNDSLYESDKPLTRIIKKGIPTYDYGEHDLKVNGDLFVADEDGLNKVNVLDELTLLNADVDTNMENIEKLPQEVIDKIYPIGSIFVMPTNTSPASILGGTWECFDKEFIHATGNATFTLSKASSGTLAYSRQGHSIYCRLTFVNSAELNDTTVNIGTINLASLGVSDLSYSKYPVGQSDGGGAILMMFVNNSTGLVTVNDVIDKGGSNKVSSGATCYVEWTNTVDTDGMLNSACDKFYWKRTA